MRLFAVQWKSGLQLRPDGLMQRIRFEDGYIVRIDSIGYGY